MIGKNFGRWIVLERRENKKYAACSVPMWLCKCSCGQERVVSGAQLRSGKSLSCGCLNDEITRKQGTKPEEIVGTRFGRLVVVDQVFKEGKTGTLWLCRCDCGSETTVKIMLLKLGKTTSCGCFRAENRTNISKKHGFSRHPLYFVWKSMIDRCTNQKFKQYKDYGGRGITVCERWLSIENFVSDMGERPSDRHSVDRKNNDGNYEPANCKWSTEEEQKSNTRRKSSTGFIGVSYIKKRKKYNAYISVNKKQISVGVFESLEDAVEARKQAEIKNWSS